MKNYLWVQKPAQLEDPKYPQPNLQKSKDKLSQMISRASPRLHFWIVPIDTRNDALEHVSPAEKFCMAVILGIFYPPRNRGKYPEK